MPAECAAPCLATANVGEGFAFSPSCVTLADLCTPCIVAHVLHVRASIVASKFGSTNQSRTMGSEARSRILVHAWPVQVTSGVVQSVPWGATIAAGIGIWEPLKMVGTTKKNEFTFDQDAVICRLHGSFIPHLGQRAFSRTDVRTSSNIARQRHARRRHRSARR